MAEDEQEWGVYYRPASDRRWYCLTNELTYLAALEMAANYEHQTMVLPLGKYPDPLALCERCYAYPGVKRHDYWLLYNEGMKDGVYWSEWGNSPRLLCKWCQHRQRAIRRWIRMRGYLVRGES